MDNYKIEIHNLKSILSNKLILNNINLKIKSGESVAIIGGSGQGKSVLLKHIIGLFLPSEGYVKINDRNLNNLSKDDLFKVRKKMGYLFQEGALFDFMDVLDNVCFPLVEHTKLNKNEIIAKAEDTLLKVSIDKNSFNKFPAELSGGMKKRVALARALMLEPEIILYDEPTSALDPCTADSIIHLIEKMHLQFKVTTIMVTHDILSAFKIANKIAFISNGEIIAFKNSEDIKKEGNKLIKQFLRCSNII